MNLVVRRIAAIGNHASADAMIACQSSNRFGHE